ncbi:MAG: (Na+)-NQR maturation NqrM [Oceanospirillaceae bacterium]|nr:(Na+)-NQR maturation NqrM [Oceanospirillaceae bacterium]
MATFFIVFAVLICVVAAMSVGVIFGGKPIAGSCGGMASLGMDTACDICAGDKQICEDENERISREAKTSKLADLGYEIKK